MSKLKKDTLTMIDYDTLFVFVDDLFDQGVTLITKIKKRMNNRFMSLKDKAMLQKRGFIETIFSSLKSLGTLCITDIAAPSMLTLISWQVSSIINSELTNLPYIFKHNWGCLRLTQPPTINSLGIRFLSE